jgi:hypothetical protein
MKKRSDSMRGAKASDKVPRDPEILVAKEGEGDFLYRLPNGGMAVLAKIAWKGNLAAQRRFLKSRSHLTQITIEEYGRLQDEGGVLIYRQLQDWLVRRRAFVIEWLDTPMERENRDLSRKVRLLLAEKRKIVEGRRSGAAATARKYQGEHEFIRQIAKMVRDDSPGLTLARSIHLILEKSEKAGHKTSRATILRYASEYLPPPSKAKP